jgi:peptidoglycan-associated lipoprotein
MGQKVGAVFWALSMSIFGAACARTPVANDKPVPLGRLATVPAAAAVERPSPQEVVAPHETEMISVFFDFDSYVLKPESGPLLQTIATKAKEGNRSVRIEGHCDERGTPEYNLALGEGRARSVQEYLERLGMPKGRMNAVSLGSQRPRAQGKGESAWSQNRRSDVTVE